MGLACYHGWKKGQVSWWYLLELLHSSGTGHVRHHPPGRREWRGQGQHAWSGEAHPSHSQQQVTYPVTGEGAVRRKGRGHPMVLWNVRLRPGKCLTVPPDRMGSPLFKSCCYCLTVLLTVAHLEDRILTYHWNLYSPFLPQTSLRFLTLSVVVFKAVYSCSGASQVAQWWRICLRLRRHRFNSWVGKIPWRRKWKPTSGFVPGKSHGQRSLVGCSPWGQRKELDAA